MLVPCHKLPKGGYEVEEECIDDVEEQQKYLESDVGEYYTFLRYNQETFDVKNFGYEAVKRVSKYHFLSISYQNPKQANFILRGSQLKDQTDFFQTATPEVQEFFSLDREDIVDINWGPLARFNIYLDDEITENNRKTESLFDVLG